MTENRFTADQTSPLWRSSLSWAWHGPTGWGGELCKVQKHALMMAFLPPNPRDRCSQMIKHRSSQAEACWASGIELKHAIEIQLDCQQHCLLVFTHGFPPGKYVSVLPWRCSLSSPGAVLRHPCSMKRLWLPTRENKYSIEYEFYWEWNTCKYRE